MLHYNKVTVSLTLHVDEENIETHLPCTISQLSEQMARQIDNYVKQSQLGYYPALEYFEQQPVMESEYFQVASHAAWLAGQIAQDEIKKKLRPIFSNIKIQGIRCLAYALPHVRIDNKNSMEVLALHYRPNVVKVDVQLSLVQKTEVKDGLERFAAQQCLRWLKDSFRSVEVNSAILVT